MLQWRRSSRCVNAVAKTYKIVYFEDEPIIIELMRDVLKHPRLEVTCARTCQQGIEKTEQSQPDLLIIDVIMPDCNGWEIYKTCRKNPGFANTPIIMVTGQMHRYRIMKQFEGSNIDAYITKPFNVGDIWIVIQKMLGEPFWFPLDEDRQRSTSVTLKKKHHFS